MVTKAGSNAVEGISSPRAIKVLRQPHKMAFLQITLKSEECRSCRLSRVKRFQLGMEDLKQQLLR